MTSERLSDCYPAILPLEREWAIVVLVLCPNLSCCSSFEVFLLPCHEDLLKVSLVVSKYLAMKSLHGSPCLEGNRMDRPGRDPVVLLMIDRD